VVKASRKFICVRLATYEDESELSFLKSIYVKGGDLQNSVFGILAPDGKTSLVRTGRSPGWAFRDAEDMVRGMDEIAAEYPETSGGLDALGLPLNHDLRLGLNIAACDRQILLVTYAENEGQLQALQKKVLSLAWSQDFIGHFLYAASTDPQDLKPIEGAVAEAGILLIEPGAYGQTGKQLGHVPISASTDALAAGMNSAIGRHDNKSVDSRAHMAKAREEGIEWKTATPVTDSFSRSHGRGRSDGRGSGRSGRGDDRRGERGGPPDRGRRRSGRDGGRSERGREEGRTEGTETGGGEDLAERVSSLKKRLEEAKKAGDKATAERLQRQVDRVIRALGGGKEGEDKTETKSGR
jgi:hypothetical protein